MQVKVADIKPYPKNAKKHPKKQVQQVANSIKRFGFLQPLVLDKNNEVIVGHGRLEAAKLLGLTEVPVVMAENLTPAEVKAYRLADNKLNESEWDIELVKEELREIVGDGIEVELTGFDSDLLVDADENDDVVPETPEVPVAKLGDFYKLGKHLLLCGDSTDIEAYKRLMGDSKADMVFTDPPYNVNYAGRGKNTSNGILNDKMGDQQFDSFLEALFKSAEQVVKGGAGWYVFHSSSTQNQFEAAMEKAGLAVRNQIIWNKPMASMGWGDYRWKHEPLFYAGKKETKLTFYGDRTNTTILDFQDSEAKLIAWAKRQMRLEKEGKFTVWSMKRDKFGEYVHPTQKPVELITYAIINSSKTDDLVLEPFCGSGSTMIACEKTGRACRAIELDPKYVDVIIKRWETFTGEKAVKL